MIAPPAGPVANDRHEPKHVHAYAVARRRQSRSSARDSVGAGRRADPGGRGRKRPPGAGSNRGHSPGIVSDAVTQAIAAYEQERNLAPAPGRSTIGGGQRPPAAPASPQRTAQEPAAAVYADLTAAIGVDDFAFDDHDSTRGVEVSEPRQAPDVVAVPNSVVPDTDQPARGIAGERDERTGAAAGCGRVAWDGARRPGGPSSIGPRRAGTARRRQTRRSRPGDNADATAGPRAPAGAPVGGPVGSHDARGGGPVGLLHSRPDSARPSAGSARTARRLNRYSAVSPGFSFSTSMPDPARWCSSCSGVPVSSGNVP